MPDIRIHENEHPRVLMNVGAALTKRIAELKDQTFTLAADWEDFKERRGFVKGLMEALTILQDIEDEHGKK
jgi:hypothetical protein